MATGSARFFDDLARVMTSAAGAAQGVRNELDTLFRTQAERVLNDLEVVQRDEFDAVREMAVKAREENDVLKARLQRSKSRWRNSPPKQSPHRAKNPHRAKKPQRPSRSFNLRQHAQLPVQTADCIAAACGRY